MNRATLAVVPLLLGLAVASTDAAVISVNFTPPDTNGAAADGVIGNATDLNQTTFSAASSVGVVPAINWNTFYASSGIVSASSGSLIDSAGATTTVSFASAAMSFNWSDTASVSNDISRLLNGQIGISNGEGTLTVSNVPYAKYDVIMYFSPNNASMSSRAGISATGYAGPTSFYTHGGVYVAGSRTAFIQATGTTNATRTTGANYALFEDLTASSFTLQLQDGGTGDPNNSLYGFQIVEIVAVPTLTAAPVSGSTIDFGTLAEFTPSTLTDAISLTNTGETTSTINITGMSLSGADPSLFAVPDFTTTTLTAGGVANILYDAQFLGAAAGSYSALLTINTSAGNVTYNLVAAVEPAVIIPSPAALPAGLAMLVVAALRRRR